MIVTLDKMKQYLRVDYPDDDEIISDIISAAEDICMSAARTDHNALTLSLRSLLFGIRKEEF